MRDMFATKSCGAVIIVLIVFMSGAACADDLTEPLISCVRVEKGPTLDGDLDDACWKKALWTSHFHGFRGIGMPPADIWMGVLHTRDALYIGWDIIKHDKADIKTGDHKDFVFMFFAPDRESETFYEFTCGARGKLRESINFNYDWSGKWDATARLTKTGWSAEVMIPFKSLGIDTPKAGAIWGFNPMRKNPKHKRDGRYVVWAEIGDRQNVADYGLLKFVDKMPGLRMALRDNTLETPIYISPLSVTDPAGIRVPASDMSKSFQIKNYSFEDKLTGWSIRYSRRTFPDKLPYAITEKFSKHGGRSLRIDSINPHYPFDVSTKIIGIKAGRYEVSAFVKLENPHLRDGVNVYASTGGRSPILGGEFHLLSSMVDDTVLPDGWRRQAVRFETTGKTGPITFGVEVGNYVGAVWIDNVQVTKCEGEQLENDGLWFWDARIPEEDGMVPRRRLFAMMEKGSPWIARGQKYNDMLVEAAFVRDSLGQLQRLRVYGRMKPDAPMSARLDAIYKTYDRAAWVLNDLYLAKKESDIPLKLDPLLDDVSRRLKKLRGDIDGALDVAIRAARANVPGYALTKMPPPKKRYSLRADGSTDAIVFSFWSKYQYRTLGRALDIYDCIGVYAGVRPPKKEDGSLDWSTNLTVLEDLHKIGVETAAQPTFIMSGMGSRMALPRPWRKKYLKMPDVVIDKGLFNFYHPAVLKFHTDQARDIAEVMRGNDRVLLYNYAWESPGPPILEPSSSPSALASLHAYMKARYKTIGAANKVWSSTLKSFSQIDEKLLENKKTEAAFRYDYEMWRQDSYIDHAKAVYETWKKVDPAKPVLAAQSKVTRKIDPTRIFETCDLLEHHTAWSLAGNLYLASTAAVLNKYLCKYECTWQYQEGTNRWGDERAQYGAVAKYAYRNALFGGTFQNWCFPYTSQPGWMWRQAQLCQTRNDYLTLRYCAAALPVAKKRIERVQHLFFLGAKRDYADVLVLWPRTTWLHRQNVKRDLKKIVLWLHRNGMMFEYRNEERIASGAENLDDYKTIIIPYAAYLKTGVSDKLIAWVRKGGNLAMIGAAGIYDKHGRPDGRLMKGTIGVVPALMAKGWDFGPKYRDVPVIYKKVGRGKVAVVATLFRYLLEYGKPGERFEEFLREGAPQLARSEGDVFEFYRRRAPDGTKYLAVLNNNPDADIESVITLNGEYGNVVDIDIPGGAPIKLETENGRSSFPLRLQASGMTVLQLKTSVRRLTQ